MFTDMHNKFLILGLSGLLAFGSSLKAMSSETSFSSDLQQSTASNDLIGRWDITMDVDGKPTPSWLEVKLSGTRTLVGSFVGASGSARPVAEVNFEGGKFDFTIPPQWEEGDQDFVIRGELKETGIQGTVTTSEGE